MSGSSLTFAECFVLDGCAEGLGGGEPGGCMFMAVGFRCLVTEVFVPVEEVGNGYFARHAGDYGREWPQLGSC